MTEVDTALSAPARDLLKRLAFRESLGACYLVTAGRGRQALVVPEMTHGNRLARLCAYSRRTLTEVFRAGLITWADDSQPIKYVGRQHLDSNSGEVVALTDAGRAVVTR